MENESTVNATNEIAGALAKAQANFSVITKSKQGQIGNQKYKYAQLADVIEAIRKPLSENGLSFTQVICQVDNKDYLRTTLLHTSGQKIESLYGLPDPRDMNPQAYGKNLTYARRYSLCSIVGVESEDDTDGVGAEDMGKKNNNTNKAPQPRAHANNPNKNYAPTSRLLNKGEIENLWGRLNNEFMFSPGEVKQACLALYNRPGMGKLTLDDAKDLMARVEKNGKDSVLEVGK